MPAELTATLDTPLPERLDAGAASVLFCLGTCACTSGEITALGIEVDRRRHPVEAFGMPRGRGAPRTGFWATVPVPGQAAPGPVRIGLHARLSGGEAATPLASIPVAARAAAGNAASSSLIAVCMATFEPDARLFAAQVESLRAQSDRDWTCVISDDGSGPQQLAAMRDVLGDDPRFRLVHSDERVGFYANFERALRLAPGEAGLVALCDQDDRWDPDKLAVLRSALGDAMLVYSDQRLVDCDGRVLRRTLWEGRRNNCDDIVSMLVANSVTGAAALMRREVAELALPFPLTPGMSFHDHWIALVALAAGDLAYVDRPLYDYVQHGDAVLGSVRDAAPPAHRRLVATLRAGRGAYFRGYVPRAVLARTLLLRCGERLTPAKRHALEQYVAAERSPRALAWLAAGVPGRRPETLGSEGTLLWGIAWRRTFARWSDTRLPDLLSFQQWGLRRWRSRT